MSRADATRDELRLALLRLQHGRPQRIKSSRKLSITAVAEEAGITPAAIHNHYPDMAEEIRTLTRRSLCQQRDAKRAELQAARQRIRDLNAEIAQLTREVEKLASENLSLLYENQLLRDLRQAAQVAAYPSPDSRGADHPTIEHGDT